MNTLDLLGRQVRYNGETGVVVSHSEPGSSRRDHLAAQRGRSVTIRIEGRSRRTSSRSQSPTLRASTFSTK